MNSPIARAVAKHEAFQSDWTFGQIIAAHAPLGVVIIRPDIVLLARPICRDWPEADIGNPMCVADDPDCWHVWMVAGDWRRCVELAPYPLPWVSMHRRERLIVMSWEDAAARGKR